MCQVNGKLEWVVFTLYDVINGCFIHIRMVLTIRNLPLNGKFILLKILEKTICLTKMSRIACLIWFPRNISEIKISTQKIAKKITQVCYCESNCRLLITLNVTACVRKLSGVRTRDDPSCIAYLQWYSNSKNW